MTETPDVPTQNWSKPVPAPTQARTLRRLGDFTLLEEIGRGGMGVVYKARQESMGRLVALKMLPSFAGMDGDAVTRFRREAEAAGRLSHPGIVPIYAVGEDDSVHWYAMELVEGPSLHRLLQTLHGRAPSRLLGSLAEETGLDQVLANVELIAASGSGARYPRSAAAIAAELASALAAAHAGGVIHRDLKPSNILIHKSGRPMLVDFGLARDQSAVGLTHSGDAVGTPSYMSPEQASGRKQVDARTDVYGLGATLYELLTLQPPFDGGHAGEIMRKILDEEALPVRSLNPRVPQDLETIVHTCLQKNPDLRYPGAEALELDLRAFLAGEPIWARRPTLSARISSAARRHRRALVVAACSIATTAILALGVGAVMLRERRKEGETALAEARSQLLAARAGLAIQAYGRALGSLDARQIAAARAQHLREAFATLYPQELAALQQALDSLPRGEREALSELEARLAGQGTLSVAVADLGRCRMALLRTGQDGIAAEPCPWAPGAALPIGRYFLQVERVDLVPALVPVLIERDRETTVRVPARRPEEVPVGFALVPGRTGAEDFAIGKSELAREDYEALRAGIADPVLRADLAPKDIPAVGASDGRLPIMGLSPWQARAAAALLGAHLPNAREFERAANGGFAELAYPWGEAFDPARAVADPKLRVRPEPVDALPRSASPFGVLHLCGNAAELLGQDQSGALWLAGGHFVSAPAEVTVASRKLVETAMTQKAYAGMRLARFLCLPDAPALAAGVEQRWREIQEQGQAGLRSTWTVDERGAVSMRLQLCGTRRDEQRFELPLVTRGFLQRREPQVRDGHDAPLRTETTQHVSAERADLRIDMKTIRAGQGYGLRLEQELVPVNGLRGQGDGYLLEIPIKAAGSFASIYEVRLPPGVRVEHVDPQPSVQFHAAGAPVLVWELGRDGRGARTAPLVLGFRRDGMLAPRWPSWKEGEAFAIRFLGALAGGDRVSLAPLLHESYLQLPAGLGRADLLLRRGNGDESFEQFEIDDVTAVGDVVAIEGRANWRTTSPAGGLIELMSWPLRLFLLREGERLRVLRLMPRSRPDTGRLLPSGGYEHPQLGVTVQPAPITRLQDGLVEMQIKLCKPGEEGVALQVLGGAFSDEEIGVPARIKLTAGAYVMRGGDRWTGPEHEVIGLTESLQVDETCHWLFGGAGGARFSRERWTFVRRGLHCFLIRAEAQADDEVTARRAFESNLEWFRATVATIRFE